MCLFSALELLYGRSRSELKLSAEQPESRREYSIEQRHACTGLNGTEAISLRAWTALGGFAPRTIYIELREFVEAA